MRVPTCMTCDKRFIVGARFRRPPIGVLAEVAAGDEECVATPGAATTFRAPQTGVFGGFEAFGNIVRWPGATHELFQKTVRPSVTWLFTPGGDGIAFSPGSITAGFTSNILGRRAGAIGKGGVADSRIGEP